MFRATTPKHSFIFDVDPIATFKTILISYKQGDDMILEKGKEDLVVTEINDCKGGVLYEAWVRLSQEEANLFDDKKKTATVQLRGLTYYGQAVASEERTILIKGVVNDEVLT